MILTPRGAAVVLLVSTTADGVPLNPYSLHVLPFTVISPVIIGLWRLLRHKHTADNLPRLLGGGWVGCCWRRCSFLHLPPRLNWSLSIRTGSATSCDSPPPPPLLLLPPPPPAPLPPPPLLLPLLISAGARRNTTGTGESLKVGKDSAPVFKVKISFFFFFVCTCCFLL